jgi:hypothetical protein
MAEVKAGKPMSGAEYRNQLFASHREQIEQTFLQARQAGLFEPVVLVLDLADDLAHRLAGVAMGEAPRDAFAKEARRGGAGPVPVVAVSREAASHGFGVMSPAAWDPVRGETWLPGRYLAIIVAGGGRSFEMCEVAESGAANE